MANYRRVAALKTPAALAEHLAQIGVDLPFDDAGADRRGAVGPAVPAAQRCSQRRRYRRRRYRQPLGHPADGRLGRHARTAAPVS